MGLTKKKLAQLPKPANVNNSSKVETAPVKKQEVKLPGLLSNYEVVAQDPLKQILSFTRRKMQNLETRKVSHFLILRIKKVGMGNSEYRIRRIRIPNYPNPIGFG